ncbi:MAG TPA: type I 3-dehydroquinate dehydratase [Thermoanaerobaculia bacterium]|nr:type I 3-dehydroquinate dehydratase [Thermoanaerobaculia bacterium]
MKLAVTILEETMEAAIEAIRALPREHDLVEVRAERFPWIDLSAVRAATTKPIILTYRNTRIPNATEALESGIDFVDLEWRDDVVIDVPERTVLSHHDYDGMHDVESIWMQMLARNCAHTKLAATPHDFADNERLLRLLPNLDHGAGTTASTVIGMSERGLYARVLAPFRGSALAFVAGTNIAAPGQLTLARALDIYSREPQRGDKVFAILGNPSGHSLSPSIHNRLFREKRVPAVYTIASFETFDEVANAFLGGEPCGLSVTTPFKDEAFAFARRIHAELGSNARRAGAVNTLVNRGGHILADNTDVDGFAALLPHATKAAILGAGGTARAARVALENAHIPYVQFNRTVSKADAPLDALPEFDGDLIINTLPGGVDVAIPPCRFYIEAAYTATPREVDAEQRIGGLELLHAQAVRQHQLFMKVFE